MWKKNSDITNPETARLQTPNGFFPKQFSVGVLNATLDLAALVLVGVVGFPGSEVVLSPVVSGCLPSCGGWVLVGVAPSRTKTFRNQNHRFQSKFAYCKLFGVYAGVIFNGLTLSIIDQETGLDASWQLCWTNPLLRMLTTDCNHHEKFSTHTSGYIATAGLLLQRDWNTLTVLYHRLLVTQQDMETFTNMIYMVLIVMFHNSSFGSNHFGSNHSP